MNLFYKLSLLMGLVVVLSFFLNVNVPNFEILTFNLPYPNPVSDEREPNPNTALTHRKAEELAICANLTLTLTLTLTLGETGSKSTPESGNDSQA